MLINELSQQTGFSIDTIRFYEKLGLLDAESVVRRANRYKDYTDVHSQRLLVIRDLKDFGFSLKEIKETVSSYEQDSGNCVKNVPKLEEKLFIIDSTIEKLSRLKEKLQITTRDCSQDCKNCCGINKTLQTLSK